MAIYQRMDDLEDRLDEAYSENITDMSPENIIGYNTAWDVATCCNEDTIWHRDDHPEANTEVLVCYQMNGEKKLAIGCWNYEWEVYIHNNWWDRVIAWAELPDIPTLR